LLPAGQQLLGLGGATGKVAGSFFVGLWVVGGAFGRRSTAKEALAPHSCRHCCPRCGAATDEQKILVAIF